MDKSVNIWGIETNNLKNIDVGFVLLKCSFAITQIVFYVIINNFLLLFYLSEPVPRLELGTSSLQDEDSASRIKSHLILINLFIYLFISRLN